MKVEQLIDQFEIVSASEQGIKKLRQIIIDLGLKGELTDQLSTDESADVLKEKIRKERELLYEKEQIRKPRDLDEIEEEEIPYKLPKNWEWARLGFISNYRSNDSISPDEISDETWVLGLGDIEKDTSRIIERDVFANRKSKSHKYKFEKGDVLYGKLRPNLNKVVIADDDGVCSTEIIPIKGYAGIINKYVKYALKRSDFLEYTEQVTYGVKMPRLGTKDGQNALFPLAPIEEQKRIVQKIGTLFTQVDELELKVQQDRQVNERLQVAVLDDLQRAETPETSRRSWQRLTDHFEQIYCKPEHIDQLKQAILNEAVRGRLVSQEQESGDYFNSLINEIDAKREELSAEGERRIKKGRDPVQQDEYLWEVPNHWRWLRFQDFILFIDYRGKTPDKTESGIRLITAKNIRSGYIDFDPAEYIAEEDYEDWMTRGIPERGDLLFTTEAPLGKIAVIDFEEKFALAQRAINFRLLGKIDPYFVQYFIMSNIFQDILLDKATGMTATGIKSTILKKTPFPIPPFEEQKKIVDKIDELFSWCDNLKEKLSRSRQTDQRLLEALVNGHSKNEHVDSDGKN